MRYELPPDFEWEPTNRWGQDWLLCGRKIVAGVSKTVFPDGRWIANVNGHYERMTKHSHAYFRSREAAMRSVERWACAHASRLRHELQAGLHPAEVMQPTREEKRLERVLRG